MRLPVHSPHSVRPTCSLPTQCEAYLFNPNREWGQLVQSPQGYLFTPHTVWGLPVYSPHSVRPVVPVYSPHTVRPTCSFSTLCEANLFTLHTVWYEAYLFIFHKVWLWGLHVHSWQSVRPVVPVHSPQSVRFACWLFTVCLFSVLTAGPWYGCMHTVSTNCCWAEQSAHHFILSDLAD